MSNKCFLLEGDYTNYDFSDYDPPKVGKYKIDYKVTGKNLSLDLNADEFTFAVWVNCDFTKMNMKQYLLCGNNQIKSSNNSNTS